MATISFYRQGNQDWRRVSNLPKTIQLLGAEAQMQTQGRWTQSLSSSHQAAGPGWNNWAGQEGPAG